MIEKNKSEVSRRHTPENRGDRIEIAKILAIGLVSFLLGFGFVIFFLKPSGPSDDADLEIYNEDSATVLDESTDTQDGENEDAEDNPSGGYAPTPADYGREASPEPGKDAGAPQKVETVPPGRTPDGVSVDDEAFYLKCWDKEGKERPGGACDELVVFEKRIATRLYVVDACRKAHAGVGSTGKLSLGVEVDIPEQELTAWSGSSTSLPSGKEVSSCVKERLAGLPLDGLDNDYDRYRIFFTIHFGDSGGDGHGAESAPKSAGLTKGKRVEVIWDHVRVRKAPVNGSEIGKISTGNKVKLLETEDGWCKVLTPNKNVGWMTCEALAN